MAFLTPELCETISSDHIDLLNKENIWTINDLCNADLFAIKRKIGINFSVLKEAQEKIKQRYQLPCHDLTYLVENSVQECKMCPTGMPELTSALDGGFQTQEIVELFGDSECGKTEMCYLLCGELLSHFTNYHILYIASNHEFDPDKIAKYTRLKAGNKELSDEDIFESLSRVQVARPSKLSDLVHLLNTLLHSDKKNQVKCIIIDSLSFIVQDDVLEIKTCDFSDGDELERFSSFKGTSWMYSEAKTTTENLRSYVVDVYLHEVMKLLTNVSLVKNVMIILTNSDQRLAFSKSWTNALDHRIHLTKASEYSRFSLEFPGSTVLNATITKTSHNLSRIGHTIPFQINDDGLFAIRSFAKPANIDKSISICNQDKAKQKEDTQKSEL